jgi:hypothetical protein
LAYHVWLDEPSGGSGQFIHFLVAFIVRLQHAPEFGSQGGRAVASQLKTTVDEPAGSFDVTEARGRPCQVKGRSRRRRSRTELPQQLFRRIDGERASQCLSISEERRLR